MPKRVNPKPQPGRPRPWPPTPPLGWSTFGTHADTKGGHDLEFSAETDDAGMPLWERRRPLDCPDDHDH